MDDFGTFQLCLHRPAKSYRMTLGHVGSLDHDAISGIQIAGINRCGAATKPRPQTGDA